MAKWVVYVLVFVYMCYRAVYGARFPTTAISVDQISYGDKPYLEVNTRQTVNCKASNRNQKLEWVDPFGNVVQRLSSNRVFTQEQFVSSPRGGRTPGLVLTFTELLVSDSGIYKCKIEGKDGEPTKNVPVCVIKPSQFVDTPSGVTIAEGRSISLTCQAKGDPEPRLVWYRGEEELTDGNGDTKYMVNRKYNSQGYESLLTITSLEPGDAGLYSCVSIQESPMLDNCNHTDTFNITLQVEHAPVFKGGNSTYVYGKNNAIVNLKCEASAWPKPTYRWFKDLGGESLLEYDKSKIIFSEDPYTATLPVTAGLTTFGNTYKCVATNSYGEAEESFILLKTEKPSKAAEIRQIHETESAIHFNVAWDEDAFYFPVDSVDIQYIEKSKFGEKQPNKVDWQKVSETIDEDTKEMIQSGLSESVQPKLEGLEPDTEYVVRLRATNTAGEAPWSEIITATTKGQTETATENELTTLKVDVDEPNSQPDTAVDSDSGMFYGIFFAGGILIVSAACMFAMRLV